MRETEITDVSPTMDYDAEELYRISETVFFDILRYDRKLNAEEETNEY